MPDPILEQRASFSVGSRPGLFASIPPKNIRVVAAYLQLIIDVSGNKTLNVKSIFDNANKIFTDDYIKSVDVFWKEHLAATLREPLDGHFETKFFNALKHIPKRGDAEDSNIFLTHISEIKEFLNDYAHMDYEEALKYITANYPEHSEITEEIFDQICKDMIDKLYTCFSKHCYRGTN